MERLVLVVLVTMATIAHVQSFDINTEWLFFKRNYSKKYVGDEDMKRRLIWESNMKVIERHNLEADRGEHSYWLGMNEYGDMTSEEFVSQMNGFRITNETKVTPSEVFTPPGGPLPEHVDWREKGYVTRVKSQGQCGSCWAFSATGSLEGQHFKKTGNLVSLSEQNLVDCSTEGNEGCEGGAFILAFEYIAKNNGIDKEASYPYEAKQAKCRFSRANVGATTKGPVLLKSYEYALQGAVATVGPVSVGIDSSHLSFRLYKRGVYDEKQCSETMINHAVLAVGYGIEKGLLGKGKEYWLVKNSWGERWGMKGYIKMSRNRNNQCGIATQASFPKV
ncbi:procathepsin L-like [Liolophura sinensis]|uniref:procathepsin L-like n=1 Tax=Liolophura sinensis TaxID=3198878 RepID=UPI003158DCAA